MTGLFYLLNTYGFEALFECLDDQNLAFGTDDRKKTPCRAGPVQKKTKNEVKKTKKLKILLSGICFGAGLSQCTFGHSQIRLQTSGHESLLAQINENWITFRKSLRIESKKNSFC